jgi:hypothetical protein
VHGRHPGKNFAEGKAQPDLESPSSILQLISGFGSPEHRQECQCYLSTLTSTVCDLVLLAASETVSVYVVVFVGVTSTQREYEGHTGLG